MTLRPVWSGTVTGARSMMAAAGRSMGRRSLAATGPLPSSGRPSGSMTRPSNPSPTTTSMTRPVRSTSSPACRCQYSPSSTTPISSSSTLNAMPSRSPGNFTNSSKPTPGRPETLAMPVAMLVIVPTSRGVRCGVNASRTWLIPANTLSKTVLEALRIHVHWLFVSGLGSSGLSSVSASDLELGFRFRFVLLFQKFADALFQRREVIRDAPGDFLSIRGEFDPADQVRRGLEPDVDFSREGFVERILYRRTLLRRQVKRAAHERGVRRCLEGLGETCFRLSRPSPASGE